jgi:hypothetical protein
LPANLLLGQLRSKADEARVLRRHSALDHSRARGVASTDPKAMADAIGIFLPDVGVDANLRL